MPDYTSIAAKVLGGLANAGAVMVLRRAVLGTFDPVAGTYSGGSSTDYNVTGLEQAQAMSPTGSVGQRYFNGTEVQKDDRFFLLAASGLAVDPGPGDLLVVSGTALTIVTVIPVRPGQVVLMYRVLARR